MSLPSGTISSSSNRNNSNNNNVHAHHPSVNKDAAGAGGVETSSSSSASTTCAAQAAAAYASHYQNQHQEQQQQQQQQQHPSEQYMNDDWSEIPQVVDARPILPHVAFFMGDLRDGLPMLNMQAAFLISAKGFNEKQVGILFFVFGMSQFLCLAPAGYFLDYSNQKINWVLFAGVAASTLTVLTAITAEEQGRNIGLMIFWKMLQGGLTAILPPGFNGITLGIVGSTGFTHQVSRNRMMNHTGTALIVASGSLLAYFLYPNIGALFLVSPLSAIGMAYNLRRIKPTHVDRDAARGLIIESPTMNEYEQYDAAQEEAAVAAAALSWQMIDDNPDSDPAHTESQKEEILNQLSSASYTRTTRSPASSPYRQSSPFSYNNLTSCGTEQPYSKKVAPTGRPQAGQTGASPSSATSSSYMPPDIFHSQLHERTTMLLTTPIHEHEEGFRIQESQMRQRPSSPQNNQLSDAFPDPSKASNFPGAHPLGRNRTGDSRGRASTRTYDSGPSYNWGSHRRHDSGASIHSVPKLDKQSSGKNKNNDEEDICQADPPRKARTPLAVLKDPSFMVFTAVIFFFHTANSSVLPLVMQSLSLEDPQAGILLSGLCILIAHAFMSYFAKICGDYSPIWGRKNLVLVGLASLTVRCFLLTALVSTKVAIEDEEDSNMLTVMILSTQILDAVGAGLIGCLQILVTNDFSGGTGRFSLMLGVTTGAMCLGGTVSGYIGQAIAQDYGYPFAFTILGTMSLVPFFLYAFFMPETLPDYARPNQMTFKKRRKRLAALLKKLSEHRRKLVAKANPFKRRKSQKSEDELSDSKEQPLHPANSHQEGAPSANSVAPLASHVELV